MRGLSTRRYMPCVFFLITNLFECSSAYTRNTFQNWFHYTSFIFYPFKAKMCTDIQPFIFTENLKNVLHSSAVLLKCTWFTFPNRLVPFVYVGPRVEIGVWFDFLNGSDKPSVFVARVVWHKIDNDFDPLYTINVFYHYLVHEPWR